METRRKPPAIAVRIASSPLYRLVQDCVVGDVSVLSFLSVLRINNLRVFNTGAGSTPVASTTFIFNQLRETWHRQYRYSAGRSSF